MMGKKGECVKPRNKVAAGFSELELCLCRETLISRLGCFPPTLSKSQLSEHAAFPQMLDYAWRCFYTLRPGFNKV